MAVDAGAAVSRQVLEHRGDAARDQAAGHLPRERGHEARIVREGTVADGAGGLGTADVDARRAVDVDPDLGQVVRDQAAEEPGRLLR